MNKYIIILFSITINIIFNYLLVIIFLSKLIVIYIITKYLTVFNVINKIKILLISKIKKNSIYNYNNMIFI